MNNFQKLWTDLTTFVKRRRGRKKNEDDNDEAGDGDEFNGDKEDDKPGKVALNGGEHGTIFGINRKIVTGIIVTAFLIVTMATYTALSDRSDKTKEQAAQPPRQEEEASNSPNSDSNNGYDALFRENQKAALQKNGKTGQNPNQPNGTNPTATGARTQTAATQVTPSTSTSTVTRAVPAIASVPAPASYSIPYTLPSAAQSYAAPAVSAPAASSNTSEASAAAEQQRSMEERFKSAIAFALGTSGGDTNGGMSDTSSTTVNSTYTAPSDNILQAGTIIPAVLYSGIDTANAGQVSAEVASDVYDSATGTNLLIPAGSQLIGSYGSGDGSSGRVNVTFTTLVMPDGGSYAIGSNIIAVDGQGYSGIAGEVHHHRGAMFANGIWNSAMTALATLGVDNVTLDTSAFTNLTQNSKPTITVEPGYSFNLYVTAPIAF